MGWQEIAFKNELSGAVTITCYPVSAVFTTSGYSTGEQIYDAVIKQDNYQSTYTKVINGQTVNVEVRCDYLGTLRVERYYIGTTPYIDKYITATIGPNQSWVGLNHAPGNNPQDDGKGSFGYGKYKIVFTWDPVNQDDLGTDYCYVESDGLMDSQFSFADLKFYITYDVNNMPEVRYWFDVQQCTTVVCQPISSVNRHLKRWRPYAPGICSGYEVNKNFGDAKFKSTSFYSKFPIDLRNSSNRTDSGVDWIPSWAKDQNLLITEDNKSGHLYYNLTLEKTLEAPTTGYVNDIILVPELTNTQSPKGPFLKLASEKTLTLKKFDNQNVGTDLYVNQECMLWLTANQNPNQHTKVIAESFCDIEVQTGGKVKLENNGEIWLQRTPSTNFQGATMKLYPNSIFEGGSSTLAEIQIWPGSALYNCGASFSGLYCILPIKVGNEVGQYYVGSQYCSGPVTHTFSNGCILRVAGGEVIIGNDSKIIFDGANSKMLVEPGSVIKLGQGASIEFKNGAYIDANGSTFTSLNSGDVWNGIKLDKSGADNIRNCNFYNASQYIEVINDNASSANTKTLTGNWFFDGKVKLGNVRFALIQSNNFIGGTSYTGDLLEIYNNITFSPSNYSLNIVTNTFKSGTIQLKLDCFNSQSTLFYVYGNHFYGLSGTARVGLYAYKTLGEFKMNTFEDSYYGIAALLKNSNLNFLSNTLKSTGNDNIELTLGSVGTLEPSTTAGISPTLYWNGGRNSMRQDNTTSGNTSSNCYFETGSTLLTDKAQNCYSIYNISSNKHIIGHYTCVEGPSSTLLARQNSWEIATPQYTLDCGTTLDYANPYGSGCIATIPGGSTYNVVDMGSGIYDTLYYEPYEEGGEGGSKPGAGGLSSISEDAGLYASMLKNNRMKNYLQAIENAKDIINNYSSSRYLLPALDGLYMGHHLSDTTGQNNTNTLFIALKVYLEEKMSQYDTNLAFTDKAYGYYIMCLVKMRQYTQAISGYENIMNNHPDPVARLAASWDRASVVLLMNGQGGSLPNFTNKSKKLNDKRPDKIAKKIFKAATESAEEKPDTKTEKYDREDKEVISQRVTKFNPSNQKEFSEKVNSDIAMLLNLGNKTGNDNSCNIPVRYNLHQNYPNPFNPQTTIKYDMPKDAFITIKIYDVLGREVLSINEFKKGGQYEVKFDASNFASGIYFYSFEANGFKDTKKMVLIK